MAQWRRKRIEVTAEDIRGGRRNNSVSCPVAYALARCLPAGIWPVVQTTTSRASRYSIRHSARVANFIRAFDRGARVRPFVAFVEVHG